nr:TspO protein [Nanoarchaeum sp.]
GIKNTTFAFIEIILLWLSILYIVMFTRKIDKKASWLLIPYLLWVTFAMVLNYLSI